MARDFFDELSDTITRTTKDLSKKAGQLYETQKIRSKIASEEQMIEKLKADIGNVIYERYKDGADTDYCQISGRSCKSEGPENLSGMWKIC